jgi:hypothetical protein
MKDIPYNDLKILIELMYCGFASLTKHQLDSIERTARALSINDLNQLLIQSNHKKSDTNDRNCNESHDYNQRKRKRKTDNQLLSDTNQELISSGNPFNNHNSNNNSFNSTKSIFSEQSILKQISNAIKETKSTDNQMNRESEEKYETQTHRQNSIQSVGKSSSHDNNNNEKTSDGRDFNYNKKLDLIRNSLNKDSNLTTQTENNTSRDAVVRCLRSSIQQSPRFEQLPYEERQHHFKLQQMRYQSLSDDEIMSSDSDQTSVSEKLLIQLNPSDVLCDSEESDCDSGNKETKDPKAMTTSQVEPIKRQTTTAIPTKGDELHLHLSPPTLTRRGLMNKSSISETNSTAESLLVYNLAANPTPVRSTIVRSTITSKSSPIMYISDPKVGQIIVSNVKESEKEIVSNWSNSGRKHTNIAPKVTRNSISSSNSITLLTSNEKKTIATPQTQRTATPQTQRTATKSGSNKKKRNNYQCNECTKAYSSQQTLTDHYKIVHQNSTENYACKVCGKAVKWKDSLRSHFKTNHPHIDSTDMIQVL